MPLCYIYAKCPFVCRTFSVFFFRINRVTFERPRKEREDVHLKCI